MENQIDSPVDGPDFYANKREKDSNADHRFENYCGEKGDLSGTFQV